MAITTFGLIGPLGFFDLLILFFVVAFVGAAVFVFKLVREADKVGQKHQDDPGA